MASGTVTVNIIGNAKSLTQAFGAAGKALDEFDKKNRSIGDRLGSIGKTLTTKVTLPIVAGFGLAAHAAADEDQQMAVLAGTLKRTAGATDGQVKATERWITSMQNATGIMDDKLRPALGGLLIAGRSTAQAESDLAVAADVAAAKHKDFSTVAEAFAKAANGNVGALGRLGVATKDASGKTLTYDQILKNASKTMGGAAAVAANTTAGKLAILKAKFSDLEENVGRILLPVVIRLTDWLGKLGEWFSNLSPRVQTIIIAGVALLAVVGPLAGAISALVTVVTALGVVMGVLASPVAAIVAAVALLALGVIYAYNHFKTFHDVVDAIGRFFRDTLWPIIQQIGNLIGVWFKVQVDVLKDAWNLLKPAVQGVGDTAQLIWNNVLQPLGTFLGGAFKLYVDAVAIAFGFIKGAVKAAGDMFQWFIDHIVDPVLRGLDRIAGAADRVIGVLEKVKSLGNVISGGGAADLMSGGPTPHAAGGTVGNGLFTVGEQGFELMRKSGSRVDVLSNPQSRRVLTGGSSGGDIVQPIQIILGDQPVVNAIIRWSRRNGGIPIKLKATG